MAGKEKLSKQERREAARAEAARIRAEQAKRDKRNRMILIGSIIAGLLLVGLAIFAIIQNSKGSQGEEFEGVTVPANADETGGIPISTDLVAGTPGEGPRVDIWLDYTCHYCILLEDQHAEALTEMIESGSASVYVHPIPLLSQQGPFSALAANASATVAEHAPEQFWDFHTALFEPYRAGIAASEKGEQVPMPTIADIEAIAAQVGVPQDVIDRFEANEFAEWGQAAVVQFVGAREEAGTPEVQVEGTVIAWSQPDAIKNAAAAAAAGEDLYPFTYEGVAEQQSGEESGGEQSSGDEQESATEDATN